MSRSIIITRVLYAVGLAIVSLLISGSNNLASAEAKESVLYGFTCGANGCGPEGPLARDEAGNLYGTTYSGGDLSCNQGQGCGTVYQLSANSEGTWSETVLYTFEGGPDGLHPNSGVILDSSGNIYGTTQNGGVHGGGIVFKLSSSGNGWVETILFNFYNEMLGQAPNGLVFDNFGNLYGTTYEGGTNCGNQGGCGTVFKLSPSGDGWTQTVLYSFNQQPDASYPISSLVFDEFGNLYGTADGGAYGNGAVFMLKHSSSGWKESVLWNFTSGVYGSQPLSVVVFKNALYGTTATGGSFGVGTVFQLTPSIGNWNINLIHAFTGGNDGGEPFAGLLRAGKNLYGTTIFGGLHEYGTVFELQPQADGTWNEHVIYNFTGGSDGGEPIDQLVAGPENLFGINAGGLGPLPLIYEISP